MALMSQLFSGDLKIEAAAVSDPARIMQGARGDHVARIQTALILLDGAAITADGAFGPMTAAAVLKFKTARDIVNRTYQTQADSVVGKMTVAVMDAELVALENATSVECEHDYCSYDQSHNRRHHGPRRA